MILRLVVARRDRFPNREARLGDAALIEKRLRAGGIAGGGLASRTGAKRGRAREQQQPAGDKMEKASPVLPTASPEERITRIRTD
jgi:hypothetical protein